MKQFFVILLMSGMLIASDAAKVVYDLTTGDAAKIEKQLIKGVAATADYYAAQHKPFKVIVVISGDAYRYFIDDLAHSPYASESRTEEIQKRFKPALESLSKKGVQFFMCATGMKKRKIKKQVLYRYVQSDKIKNVYLIDAQNAGYAYLPIH